MLCHMYRSTATVDVMMTGGSRVLCQLDSLTDTVEVLSDRYIRC